MVSPQPTPGRPAPSKETTKGGAERRRWARSPSELPITVTTPAGTSEARVRDVSRAGVCFFLDRPIPMMTVLEVALDLKTSSGPRHVSGHGAVVRCEKISKALEHYEIAVFLHEMSDGDRRSIEEYVATLPRD